MAPPVPCRTEQTLPQSSVEPDAQPASTRAPTRIDDEKGMALQSPGYWEMNVPPRSPHAVCAVNASAVMPESGSVEA